MARDPDLKIMVAYRIAETSNYSTYRRIFIGFILDDIEILKKPFSLKFVANLVWYFISRNFFGYSQVNTHVSRHRSNPHRIFKISSGLGFIWIIHSTANYIGIVIRGIDKP
ncbi:hypothetical protein D3C80_1417040 [compost metagenome]